MRASKRDLDAKTAARPTAAEELVTMRTRTARVTNSSAVPLFARTGSASLAPLDSGVVDVPMVSRIALSL